MAARYIQDARVLTAGTAAGQVKVARLLHAKSCVRARRSNAPKFPPGMPIPPSPPSLRRVYSKRRQSPTAPKRGVAAANTKNACTAGVARACARAALVLRLLRRELDHNLAAVDVGAARLSRRRSRLLLGGHDDEAEAARAAGLAVVDDLRARGARQRRLPKADSCGSGSWGEAVARHPRTIVAAAGSGAAPRGSTTWWRRGGPRARRGRRAPAPTRRCQTP